MASNPWLLVNRKLGDDARQPDLGDGTSRAFTPAAEREVPLDVLQENLGQSDPRTTARYYRAQLERRQRAMEESFAE